MREPWVDAALVRLPDTRSCPACAAPLRSTRCDRCRLDLTGPLAFEVADASTDAVEALARRQQALDALRAAQPDAAAWAAAPPPPRPAHPRPLQPRPPHLPPPHPGAYRPGPPPRPVGPARSATGVAAPARSAAGTGTGTAVPAPSVGLQPVLAAAGAGLLAVAVVVFVFFTFGDALALRAVATGVVTVLTVAAAVGLRRAGLRSSAEAVAALAVVLALVDAELALQAGLLAGADPVLARSVTLGVVLVLLGVAGDRARVRAWVAAAVVLAPVVPLLAGAAGGRAWSWTLGLLAAALTTCLGDAVARRAAPRVGRELARERAAAVVWRAVLLPVAVVVALGAPSPGTDTRVVAAGLLLACAVTAATLRVVTHERPWVAATGVTAVLAGGLAGATASAWWVALVPAGALLAWAAVVGLSGPRAVVALRRGAPLAARTRTDLVLGGLAVLGVLGLPAVSGLAARVLDVLAGSLTGTTATLGPAPLGTGAAWALPVGGVGSPPSAVTAVHLGLVVLVAASVVAGRTRLGVVRAVGRGAAPWLTLALLLGLVLDPRLAGVTSLVLLVVLAVAALVGATRGPVARAAAGSGFVPWRAAAVTGTFVATGLVLAGSWTSRPTALLGGVAVGGLLLAARAAVPRAAHAPLVGVAYGYALVVLGVGLGWAGFTGVAASCTVATVAALTALVVTLARRVGTTTWWAVLGVTALPFALGVATVVVERSWWSVVACAAMIGLEAVLVLTRRAGAVPALRVLAAGLALPTAAVAVVSAGAMLVPGSGSPVVLPVVAALVAAVAASARGVGEAVGTRAATAPGPVRVVLETSAAVTGAIAVGLAYGRPAAGPEVAVAVLLLLAAGAGVVARNPDRRAAWWLTASLATVATWTALGAAGVGVVEAYTAPPALAAVLVGTLLVRRAARVRRALDLATAGAVLLVAPSLLVLAATDRAGDVRATLLVSTAGATVLLAALAARSLPVPPATARVVVLRLAVLAVLAGAAGTVEAVHVAGLPGGGAVFALGAAWSFAGGAVAGGAGLLAQRTATPRWRPGLHRWALAPALVLVVVGVVVGVRPVWGAIATVWALEVALLVLLVLWVRRALRGVADLPPAWFTWLLALVAAIGAWSPRELRVEVFSLPLGAGLVLAGYLALVAHPATTGATPPAGHDAPRPGSATGPGSGLRPGPWPLGRVGSWALLAPGILATLGPSVLATYTDARTWRAMLVVVLALAAVLIGTRKHLAAPFLLGVAVLPVEILVVFVSQLGTRISAGPWMLTLAAAGGLLLIIATYYERRISAFGGAAAYVRDLR
ncbi:SCO7613 C-terminal domain-containing membrane protein [Cellulosimicrobium marinum]|uniref:SCO7613 C-terminal domain-containing membrane protein n=1 Tax=Cellulosimicrobium marinum TaxID=1638992 RepID=UPI001E51774A|nr:hypothetical protein [Cellulosimicrobium marinum]MCB7135629.1 hypothetical protein [Cellulosimicrobium marinum]